MAKDKNKIGRPTVMTPETIGKLEEVFALGGSDKEACFYAGINGQTLYDYQKKYPRFIERKEALKETPILKARRTVVDKLDENYGNAMDFLKRKKKKEFGDKVDVTSDGKELKQLTGFNYVKPDQGDEANNQTTPEAG